MNCRVCKRLMTLLFTSYACDFCDGLKKVVGRHRGYVVWDESKPSDPEGRSEYVFPTRVDATRYQRAMKRDKESIREINCESEIKWHVGRGIIKDLSLADQIFKIFPDHRFEPGPYRAWLSPEDK